MSKNIASVSALLLATLAGCAVPVSNGTDEATLSSALGTGTTHSLAAMGPPPVPALAAAVQFSEDADAEAKTYPDDPVTIITEGTTKRIYLWAFTGNVTPGTHIVWAMITDPTGTLVDTLPIAFSTTKPADGATVTPSGWDSPIDVAFGRPSEMETGTGTLVGFEAHTSFAVSDLKVKKTLPLGLYTATLVQDDDAVPGNGYIISGTGTFTMTAGS